MRFVKYLLLLSILLIFTGCFPGYGDDDGNIQPDNTYGWEKLALGSNQYGMLQKAILFNNAIYTASSPDYYKSTDGGVTWYSWFSDSLNCYGLFADSTSLFMCTDKGIYRMDKTETQPKLISDKIGFTISASNNNYLYGGGFQPGSNSPSGFLSTDRGATWNLIINEVFIWGAYLSDNYLYESGKVPGREYSIYRISLDEQRTITDLGKISSRYGASGITFSGGRLYAGASNGIFYLNTINTWSNIFGKTCFNPFYNFGRNIYTGNTSLYYSRDSGYTWHDRPIPDQSMQIVNVFELGNYTYLQTYYYLWRLLQTSL